MIGIISHLRKGNSAAMRHAGSGRVRLARRLHVKWQSIHHRLPHPPGTP
ncbi:hypothetical protein D3OALGA1CA_3683 [Olavius algarvensis associated proteobacterium Delta 3]|nr:hypothetical protein D3OALGA1CA_3683 [Olavius algarvensis associated proteobacterium Delta 3]CAB5148274.1 hypothetical protein D3OALGB2SA_4644 [Olavius algarvensis associated proteobacterium Delta 3]